MSKSSVQVLRTLAIAIVCCLMASHVGAAGAEAVRGAPATGSGVAPPAAMSITYLVADAVNFGSTAFRMADSKAVVFIEAFPARKACKLDPNGIKKADLIIENVHGHRSHYDPDVCALVARNTGAFVLGNAQLKKDMLKRRVPEEKIVELSPAFGEKVRKKISALNVTVTAFGMEHTMLPGLKVDTFSWRCPTASAGITGRARPVRRPWRGWPGIRN